MDMERFAVDDFHGVTRGALDAEDHVVLGYLDDDFAAFAACGW